MLADILSHANFPTIATVLGSIIVSFIGGYFLFKGKSGETREQHASKQEERIASGYAGLIDRLQTQLTTYDARMLRFEESARLQDEKMEQMRVALEALRNDFSITEAAVERAFDDLHRQWQGTEIPKFRTGDLAVLTPLLPPQWIPPDRH